MSAFGDIVTAAVWRWRRKLRRAAWKTRAWARARRGWVLPPGLRHKSARELALQATVATLDLSQERRERAVRERILRDKIRWQESVIHGYATVIETIERKHPMVATQVAEAEGWSPTRRTLVEEMERMAAEFMARMGEE